MSDRLTRRLFLQGSLAGAATLLLPGCAALPPPADDLGFSDLGGADLAPTPACPETVEQILGPYYRAGAPFRTRFPHAGTGRVLVVEGVVRGAGSACTPLGGALLDVWGADHDATYDQTTAGFACRGRLEANPDGSYRFETVLPGHYLNGAQYRPRHLHLRISHPGYTELVTQLYFTNDPHLAADPFYHPSLVVPLVDETTQLRATFPITLAR
jgi:protocatechuate 3,4-dioxygenase beta subunit